MWWSSGWTTACAIRRMCLCPIRSWNCVDQAASRDMRPTTKNWICTISSPIAWARSSMRNGWPGREIIQKAGSCSIWDAARRHISPPVVAVAACYRWDHRIGYATDAGSIGTERDGEVGVEAGRIRQGKYRYQGIDCMILTICVHGAILEI